MAAQKALRRVAALLLVAMSSTQFVQLLSPLAHASCPLGEAFSAGMNSQSQKPMNRSCGVKRVKKVPRMAFDNLSLKKLLHLGRWPMIWKEKWIGPANLDRAGLRLSGQDTYALVAAVLLQVLVGLYGATSQPEDNTSSMHKRLFEIQMLLLMISINCGTYTMVTFLLNKIYSSTALGMYKDVDYAVFFNETARHRVHAFWSLITCMITFMLSFSLNVMQRMKGKRGIVAAVLAVSVGSIMVYDWTSIMLLADKLIFKA